MTRPAILLLSLAAVALSQDVAKPAALPFSLPPLPTLPPFSMPTLPTILPTPIAIKMPSWEEMSAAWSNGVKDLAGAYSKEDMYKMYRSAGTNFANMIKSNQENMAAFGKIASEAGSKIMPAPAEGSALPKIEIPTLKPIDSAQAFTLPPLPFTLPTLMPLPSFPTLPPFKLPFREGEKTAGDAVAASVAAAAPEKKESLPEIGLPKLELPTLAPIPTLLPPPFQHKPVVNDSAFAAKATKMRRSNSESSYRTYSFQETSFGIPESVAASGSLRKV